MPFSFSRLLRGEFNQRAETTRFYVDKGWNDGFISYVAIPNRLRLWDLYSCHYLPERLSPRADLSFEKEVTHFSIFDENDMPYRAALLRNRHDGRNLRFSTALACLKEREDLWIAKGVHPEDRADTHSHHYTLHRPAPCKKQSHQRK